MTNGGLRVHLLGGLTVYPPGSPPTSRFPTQKTAALLALLALSPGRRFPREVIIDRLWTDAPVENGRRSLRVALTALRRILEPTGTPEGTVLSATRETVSLRAEAVSTDVSELDAALRAGDGQRVGDLYAAGPLLPAFYEDWILVERERLEEATQNVARRGHGAVALAEPLATLPPPVTSPTRRDPRERLPSYLTRFVGRDTEIETLTALWDDAGNRCITVTGPGGVGKTRFLVRAAALTAARTETPILRYVSLADAPDKAAFVRAVAAALGLDTANADGPAVVIALEALGRSRLLLDNLEQLVDAGIADTLREWLAACPGLQVVATSRQRLLIPGERELPLLPLETPTFPATPERLLDFAAVRLFLDRAAAVRSDAMVNPRNAEVVGIICDRLGGLPLPLELTAAWAGALTFRQMLARVEAHLLDETGPPTAHRRAARPERHRTLRAALETSLELLTPDLRAAFADLAVFRGGFSADAARTVLGDGGGAAETLSRLRERSLLVADADEDTDTLRFRFLPAIYAFARELREAEVARANALSIRHRDYYLRVAETPREIESVLDAEVQNFRAASDTAGDSDDDTALRLCVALFSFWDARGHIREGFARTERAIDRCPEASPALILRARHCAGKLAYNLNDFAASRRHHEASLPLAESENNPAATGKALQGIASCLLYADTDLPRALALCEAARVQFQLAGDTVSETRLLQGQAVIAQMTGDYEKALALQMESLRLAVEACDDLARANALNNIGGTLIFLRRLSEVAPYLETALALFTRIGNQHRVASTLHEMGTLAYENDDFDAAVGHYESALLIYREQGEVWAMAICLSNLGRLSAERGETARAATLIGEALNLRMYLGDKHALLQSVGAVVNLLFAVATPAGRPPHRASATEAIRLRAADNANRAALGLAAAPPDDVFVAESGALWKLLGATVFRRAEAEGASLSLAETVAAARDALAQIR